MKKNQGGLVDRTVVIEMEKQLKLVDSWQISLQYESNDSLRLPFHFVNNSKIVTNL